MAFELNHVVPWGRNLAEYQLMFDLSVIDLNKRIISFGDGPASVNTELTQIGKNYISLDPIYQFSKEQLCKRFEEVKQAVIQQVKANQDNFIWTAISSVQELEQLRTLAMEVFLADYERGLRTGRYIAHELPHLTSFEDNEFDLGLSSHFLILYEQLGLNFHLNSLQEMLRICKEVRIFPLLNLNAQPSKVLAGIIEQLQSRYLLNIKTVPYEFQKGGNQMLVIGKQDFL